MFSLRFANFFLLPIFSLWSINQAAFQKASQSTKSTRPLFRRFPLQQGCIATSLPIMPKLIESFDLSAYDLVISSSHCVAKGVIKKNGAFHFSYVHAPMRYMWDRFNEYFGQGKYSPPVRMAARLLRPYLQMWDKKISYTSRCFCFKFKVHRSKSEAVLRT